MGTDGRMLIHRRVDGCWTFNQEQPLRRNYELFGLLAGVRSDNPSPIVPPRGAPADLMDSDESWDVWHTVTWYTLDELLRHDWQTPLTRRGVVSAQEYQRYLDHGEIRDHSESVSGNVTLVSNEEMAAALRAGQADWRLRTEFTWQVTQAQVCAAFLQQLEALRAHGDPADVRLTLQFD